MAGPRHCLLQTNEGLYSSAIPQEQNPPYCGIYFIGFLVLIYGIDITNNFKYLKGIYPDSLIAKSTLSATLIFILITILALVFLPYP